MPILEFMNEPKLPIADDHTHDEIQELRNKLNSYCWRMDELILEVDESASKISMLEDELKKMKVKK